MKLARYGEEGQERVALVDGEALLDVSDHLPSLGGGALNPDALAALRGLDRSALAPVEPGVRLGACIAPGGKIVCAGLNYADHAREAGMEVPPEPVLFMKGCRLSGPADGILIPAGAGQVDWEVELAVVIGREIVNVGEDEAAAAIAGYATFIDVSERSWQMTRGGQWVKGKSWPSFAPLGPWLVTPDELSDVQDLSIWLEVNGERVQAGSTSEMIVGARALVSYVSRFMALYPGDVIATGTPAGVGMGLKPPRYLKAGDQVRAGIDGLGVQAHVCRA